MTVDRWVHVFAGTVILVSLLLGAQASPLFASSWWLLLTAFVGANLFQYGFTNVCPLAFVLRRMGVPEARFAR
jgi:hypothetical protein